MEVNNLNWKEVEKIKEKIVSQGISAVPCFPERKKTWVNYAETQGNMGS